MENKKIKRNNIIALCLSLFMIVALALSPLLILTGDKTLTRKEVEEVVLNDPQYTIDHSLEERLVDYYDNGLSFNDEGTLIEITSPTVIEWEITPKHILDWTTNTFTVTDPMVIEDKVILISVNTDLWNEDWADHSPSNPTFLPTDLYYPSSLTIIIDTSIELVNSVIAVNTITSTTNDALDIIQFPFIGLSLTTEGDIIYDEASILSLEYV